MAHASGTVNTLVDLVAAFRAFGESCGWTTDRSGSDVGYGGLWFCHNAGGDYFSVAAIDAATLGICGNTGYDASADHSHQPGTCVDNSGRSYTKCRCGAMSSDLGGPYVQYDFFGAGAYLHAVVEVSAGVYRHFGLGHLDQSDDTVGGAYAYGTIVANNVPSSGTDLTKYPFRSLPFDSCGDGSAYIGNSTYQTWGASIVRADGVDGGPAPHWWPIMAAYDDSNFFSPDYRGNGAIGLGNGPYRYTSYTVMSNRHPDSIVANFGRSDIGNQTLLMPSPIYLFGASSGFYLMGTVPDWRVLNMSGLSPRQVLTLGTDQWLVIPAIQLYAAGVTTPHTQALAYAYRLTDD